MIDYLLTREINFSQINNFEIDPINEWSDHSPIKFSLCCNKSTPITENVSDIKFKWDNLLRERYRAGLISKLPVLNNLTTNIDYSNRDSVNHVINDFTQIIRDVSDPLFSKRFIHKNNIAFSDESFVKHEEWFDNDCIISKNKYLESLRIYSCCKTVLNREHFCKCKKEYKDTVKKKKRSFELKKISEIEKLKHCKPKEFWKYFKKKNKNTGSCDITLDEFRDYFSSLSNDIFQMSNEDAETFCAENDFNCQSDELDQPITVAEILSACKRLKSGKASGSDFLLNEYFMESIDILGSHLCDIFKAILTSGYFPDKWTEGVIIPIHKKGSINDANNYRGITLVSCLSKLFTTILNKRIETFCNENDIISDAQFGFRKGGSTVDAIFVSMMIIQNYLCNN